MGKLENLKLLNNTIWKYWFPLLKPMTDNVLLLILLTCVSYGVIITLIRFVTTKKKGVGGVTDIVFITSVTYMLRRLYLIHRRIYNALKYSAYIILKSNSYMKEFQFRSGLSKVTEPKIAETLYRIRPEEWETWTMTRPHQLYYRVGKAFRIVRSFGKGYIDDKIPLALPFLILLITLSLFLLVWCMKKKYLSFIQAFSVFVCLIIILMEKNRMNGTIVAFIALLGTEYIVNYNLNMLHHWREEKRQSKLHINSVKPQKTHF